jgi:hypothetical protein
MNQFKFIHRCEVLIYVCVSMNICMCVHVYMHVYVREECYPTQVVHMSVVHMHMCTCMYMENKTFILTLFIRSGNVQ